MRAALSTTYDYRIHYKETGVVWKLSSFISSTHSIRIA